MNTCKLAAYTYEQIVLNELVAIFSPKLIKRTTYHNVLADLNK